MKEMTALAVFGIYVMAMALLWACAWRLRLLRREKEEDERSCSFVFSTESWERLQKEAEDGKRTPTQELNYAMVLLDTCRVHAEKGGKILLLDASGKAATELKI